MYKYSSKRARTNSITADEILLQNEVIKHWCFAACRGRGSCSTTINDGELVITALASSSTRHTVASLSICYIQLLALN